jgi:hypothetical protein
VIEQLVSVLWQREVVDPTQKIDASTARRNQLSDTRTWTASARLEMLFQKSILSSDTFAVLSKARKARNELSHQGASPAEADARAAYEGACALLTVALEGDSAPMFNIDLADHTISDPFAPQPLKGEPSHWMAIPKLPGEEELERVEAEATARRTRRSDPHPETV